MIKVSDIHGGDGEKKIFLFQTYSIKKRFKRNKKKNLRFFIYLFIKVQ
jgi:hypothetical protein